MPIDTKTIGELKGHHFKIPSYQRGYRWTEHEVNALLDDIEEFSTAGDKRYCIQPLIVKPRPNGSYEVVDGQQRLTTIYLFMKIASQEIRSAIPPFSLEYETRPKESTKFLESITENDLSNKDDNIDFFHIANAYIAIDEWLKKKPEFSVSVSKLNIKIRESTFFIWYDLPYDIDPIPVFTKVNLGKIPLTNAELIKALILKKDNFCNDVDKQQFEISVAWDKIEQGLHEDSFWGFLNEKDTRGTRIDLLFDLLAQESNAKLSKPIPSDQNYFSFLVFFAELKMKDKDNDKQNYVNDLWKRVEKLYAEFREWYNDLNKYHIIGYLIAIGVSITDIFAIIKDKRKKMIIIDLLEKIKKEVPDALKNKDELSKIAYENNTNTRNKIRKLILLFNIATLVCKSEKEYRFPFDIYKNQIWNIEHIHAIADKSDEADDGLGNLTLLDENTNKEYKDFPFEFKRKIIIDREKEGRFVPLCTKNVFLKVYSKNIDMSIWDEDDKQDYLCAIETTIKSFLKGEFLDERNKA